MPRAFHGCGARVGGAPHCRCLGQSFPSLHRSGYSGVGVCVTMGVISSPISVLPVAFATTVPAEALTGRLDAQTLLGALALAAGLLVASRLFWRAGVRHYSGASA